MQPGALILMAVIDPTPLGTTFRRQRLEWPLHVTVLHWFTVPERKAFELSLRKFLGAQPSFTAEVGREALFGQSNDIPVQLIANQAPLLHLHKRLLAESKRLGATLVVQHAWIGDAYTAHITTQGESLSLGQKVPIKYIDLVELQANDMCQFITRFPLK